MGQEQDSQRLMQALAAGERQALAGLMKRFQRPLFSFLGRMGIDQAKAEDIAQETFLKAWSQAHRYQPELAQPGTWLFTIARNLALHHLSSAAHRLEENDPGHAGGESGEGHQVARRPEAASDAPGPLESLDRRQQQRRLVSAIRRLPLEERSLIGLAYVQELDMSAIAAIENLTAGAVKTRLHRARLKLRLMLEQDHG